MSQVDNLTSHKDALEGLEAYLDSLDGDPNVALEKLAGKTDPVNVRRRLSILINMGRLEDAATEVRSREKSEAWIDLAVSSLAATGADVEAKEYVEWAKEQSTATFWQRSAIGHYDGTMNWILRSRSERESIIPGTLSSSEKEQIQSTVEIVEAACAPALAAGRVEAELDVQLLSRLLDASYLLQSREKLPNVIRLLEKRVPIPLKIAQAVVQEVVDPVANMVERLWIEHGESFRARFLACVIQARKLNTKEIALSRAYELVGLAKSAHDKEDLCEILYELTNISEPVSLAKVKDTIIALLGEAARFLKVVEADTLLRRGDAAAALAIVAASDFGTYPQGMYINALATLRTGKSLEALRLFQELAKVAPEPRLFKIISDLARKHEQEIDEREALEHLVALAPSERNARHRLSWLYVKRGDYRHAAPHLELLHAQFPDEIEVTVNLAVIYSFNGQHDSALAILTNAVGDRVASLPIVKTRAQILHSLGRSVEAFDALEAVHNDFWEDPQFLSLYLTIGHAADREPQAHEAFKRLLELREKGVVDEDTIHTASFDEVRELLSRAAKQSETIARFVLEGKFPWLLSAAMKREALYWSWTMRTQSLPWLIEDALNRASYSIYATNGYRVMNRPNESSSLTELRCAAKGEKVVADVSALITLHSLGLLEKAAEHFETVLVPSNYLPMIISDLRQLFPHQLSQKKAAEQIKQAVDQKRIYIQGTEAASQRLAVLDEYEDEKGASVTPYRLRDLVGVLHANGLVTDAQRDRAMSVAHKESTVPQNAEPLKLSDRILVGEDTLVTLSGIGWLDLVVKYFSVFIQQKDLDETISRIRTFQALDMAQAKHKNLWDCIQSNKRFEFVPVTNALAISSDEEPDRDIAMVAYLAAKEKHLPLLVDDRVCQGLLLNDWKDAPVAAFGTDLLVYDMAKVGTITEDQAADALLQLMTWRYRFIMPPPKILKILFDRYRSHPPGAALRQIAVYVHDCMRDEGLFGGIEATNPPVSIAWRLYQDWIQNVAEFVIDVWLDDTVDEERAQEVTTWAITEFLPSPPYVANERLQSLLASLTPRTAITRAMIRSSYGQNLERINRALRTMSAAFGLDDIEYLEIVAGVVNGS